MDNLVDERNNLARQGNAWVRDRLAANAWKGTWRHLPMQVLIDKLYEEVEELVELTDPDAQQDAWPEAGDVAAVAFMIAHNIYAYRLLRNGQEGGFWPGDRQ